MEKFTGKEYKAMVEQTKEMKPLVAITFLNNLQDQLIEQIKVTTNKMQKDSLCKAEEALIDERDRREEENIEDGKAEGSAEDINNVPRGTSPRKEDKKPLAKKPAPKKDKPEDKPDQKEEKEEEKAPVIGMIFVVQEKKVKVQTQFTLVHIAVNGQMVLEDTTPGSPFVGEMVIIDEVKDSIVSVDGRWSAKIIETK